MNYPKKIMKMTELEKLGFPREHLEYAYRRKGQTFAFKMNPTKKNSAILFDTEEYEKWRIRMAGQ